MNKQIKKELAWVILTIILCITGNREASTSQQRRRIGQGMLPWYIEFDIYTGRQIIITNHLHHQSTYCVYSSIEYWFNKYFLTPSFLHWFHAPLKAVNTNISFISRNVVKVCLIFTCICFTHIIFISCTLICCWQGCYLNFSWKCRYMFEQVHMYTYL